jgi:S-adenosylmethionine hydrolase
MSAVAYDRGVAGPFVSLLTDFGARDPSGGILHGVILDIAPDARVVDISHEVRKFAIRDAALLLWCAVPYLPVGVHVAVVDPGVGTDRRPIAIRAVRGDTLVGPDNGLLPAAAERLGGIVAVHELAEPRYRLPLVSTSFHGRDIFAPAAAHLGTGVPIEALGPAIDPTTLVASPISRPVVRDGTLHSSVVYVDTFGNVKLAALRADLEAAVGRLRAGDELAVSIGADVARLVAWRTTFGEAAKGELLLYEDSYGRVCLAANQADAAAHVGLSEDLPITIRRD